MLKKLACAVLGILFVAGSVFAESPVNYKPTRKAEPYKAPVSVFRTGGGSYASSGGESPVINPPRSSKSADEIDGIKPEQRQRRVESALPPAVREQIRQERMQLNLENEQRKNYRPDSSGRYVPPNSDGVPVYNREWKNPNNQ